MYQFMLLASRFGLLNLLGKVMGEKAAPPILMKFPPEIRPTYLKIGFQPRYFQSNLDELSAIAESDKQLNAAGSLDGIALVVVRHGIPDLFASMPAGQAKQSEQIWQQLQADLAKRSSNSKIVTAEKTGHAIQIEQPNLVVNVIRQMVKAVRKDSSSAQENGLVQQNGF